MPRKPTRKGLIKKLDAVFSEYIRLRTANENGFVECVTCGKQDHWRSMDCGHFISRKHISTRWHEDNCQVQCKSCNVFRYGEQYKYSLWLGAKKSEYLYTLSKETLKLYDYDLLDMIEIYKEKVAELKKCVSLR
jgi:hypothetical protein